MKALLLVGALLTAFAPCAHGQVTSRITGTVYDSIGSRHLSDALIQLVRGDNPAATLSTRSDAEGRYAFDSVSAGTWLIGFYHPMVDSLGLDMPTLRIDINRADPVRAMLTIPSAATVVRNTCGPLPKGHGLWYGRVKNAATGGLAAGATVLAQWSTLVVQGTSISRQLGTVEDTARDDGLFAMCGVGTDEIVVARSWLGPDSSGVATLSVPSSGLLYRDLWIAPVIMAQRRVADDSLSSDSLKVPVRVGDRSLRGRVARVNGSPVEGARLRVPDSGVEVVTNSNGFFTVDSLPAGTQTVDLRALGFLPVTQTVDLAAPVVTQDFVLESRTTYLDTVKVIGQRIMENPRYLDFLQRKKSGFGYFLDEDQIERRQPVFLADLLRLTPGIMVMPSTFGGGSIRMRGSSFTATCSPAVFVDGMLMAQLEGVDIESFINVQDVRAVEVYARTASIPSQFMTLTGCGSIVITTGARRKRPS